MNAILPEEYYDSKSDIIKSLEMGRAKNLERESVFISS